MTIGLDLDDVLAAFNLGWVAFHNAKYGTNLSFNDLTDYDYAKVFHVDDNVIWGRVFEFYESEDFKKLFPLAHSQQGVNNLSKDHKLYVITARNLDIKNVTLDWLNKYYPNQFEDVILTNIFTKNANHKVETKVDVCKRLNVDLMIEDAPHHAEAISACNKKVILLSKPWNKNFTGNNQITRVNSWAEIDISKL